MFVYLLLNISVHAVSGRWCCVLEIVHIVVTTVLYRYTGHTIVWIANVAVK